MCIIWKLISFFNPKKQWTTATLFWIIHFIYFHCIRQGILKFIQQVVNQIEVNLRRIHALGVKKIAIPTLQPIGCIPYFSKDSLSQKCNDTLNALVKYHNSLLLEVVAKLNKETKKSTFVTIDLFNAFLTIIKNGGDNPGNKLFLLVSTFYA